MNTTREWCEEIGREIEVRYEEYWIDRNPYLPMRVGG